MPADHPYLQGKGGRMPNNDLKLMQGLSVKSLKHHVALQPLFVIMTAGIIFVGAYCGRLAFKGHDVNFSEKKDPVEVMGTLENKQFKMFNPSGFDYSTASASTLRPTSTGTEQVPSLLIVVVVEMLK